MGKKVKDLSIFEAVNTLFDGEDKEELGTILPELFSDDKDFLWEVDLSLLGYELIEGEFGGEGEGEYCWAVIKFQDKFYKGEYNYYSYDGCDFDNLANSIQEVFPKEKTITVYE